MSNSFSNDHCIVYRPRSGALKFHYALGSKRLFMNKILGTLNRNTPYMFRKIKIIEVLIKGQLISKPIYDLLTSPKKRTDEFDLFAFLLFTANKSNSSVRFFGESTARQSAF